MLSCAPARRLAAPLAALVACATLSAGALAKQPARHDPSFGARIASCDRSPRIEKRTAVVSACMRPTDGAPHLPLKVDLFQRPLGAGRWALRADVPGLGRWTTPSDPSLGSRASDL